MFCKIWYFSLVHNIFSMRHWAIIIVDKWTILQLPVAHSCRYLVQTYFCSQLDDGVYSSTSSFCWSMDNTQLLSDKKSLRDERKVTFVYTVILYHSYSIADVWLFLKLSWFGIFKPKYVRKPVIKKKLQTNKTLITWWSWKLKLLNTKTERCKEGKQRMN